MVGDGVQERLGAVRVGRAALREAGEVARTSISDLDVRPELAATQPPGAVKVRAGSRKLAEAHKVGEEMERELRALCAGVIERLNAIGIEVASAASFKGFRERSLAAAGRVFPGALDRAQRLRLQRLEHASTEEAVMQVREFVAQTIKELGEIEGEYNANVQQYRATITRALTKLAEATPRQIVAVCHREELEAQAKALELDLKAGTITQSERPGREAAYEALKRQLDAARLAEIENVTIVNEAQRAIPELQKNAEAAARTIESIHGMRRNLLEKTENLATLLERAVTSVRARAKLERYQAVDPAFNRTVEMVTAHNIAVAGAAMEVAAERLKHAAIDPVRSKELLDQLLGHVTDFLKDFAAIEDEARRGVRGPVPDDVPAEGSDQ